MDYQLVFLFFLLMAPLSYIIIDKMYLNRFVIDETMKRTLNKIVNQALQENNMDKEWTISDYRNFEMSDDYFEIEVFIIKTGENKTWNVVEQNLKIKGKLLENDTYEILNMSEMHVHDYREIEPENTSNILTLSAGLPNKIRQFFSGFVTVLPEHTDDSEVCNPGTRSSIMCKNDTLYRTNETFEESENKLEPEYGLQSKNIPNPVSETSEPFECKHMNKYLVDHEITGEENIFKCRLRDDIGFNPNILTVENFKGNDDDFIVQEDIIT